MNHCKICNCRLNDPNKPESLDCGGDCLACMAEAGDPECMQAMYPILKKEQTALVNTVHEINKTIYAESTILGSSRYFKVRKLCCDVIAKYKKPK